ncbi:hypothetical protein POJ06DRAFT_135715 [Lipomyces tetrasporus]|uniref:NmrA-like domain-containing protein n=1 Tax=Lipomyces tetrasporus TaxID=54092 RepID=A0AAD7QQP7_9ASCO|nr:uncharacterized protein POJ06DRAFT_135715 [Lipomyces tetrasporus]KAJ8099481.1 hypothetical protein POJ06DRAFT_135715 [Lipomyces tetrasporus]
MLPTVLVVGGTGAQGSAIVRLLSESGRYSVQVPTRNAKSPQAKELADLQNVSVVEADIFSEADLMRLFSKIDMCFINTNGFAIGEKNEIYWSIRMHNIARFCGVKHFVYGSLDYASKKVGFDPKYRCGHMEGKGIFADFLASQSTSPMNWSIVNSGPYMETLSEIFKPRKDESGVYVFALPLADGALPLICLNDLAAYALWMLDNPEKCRGLSLAVSTQHASGEDIVKAFTSVTGKPARYEDVELEEYLTESWKSLPNGAETKIGESFAPNDPTLMTYRQNFRGWWNLFRASGGNKGLLTRDYHQLDEILPTRIKSVAEWIEKSGYTGEAQFVLKDRSDRGF